MKRRIDHPPLASMLITSWHIRTKWIITTRRLVQSRAELLADLLPDWTIAFGEESLRATATSPDGDFCVPLSLVGLYAGPGQVPYATLEELATALATALEDVHAFSLHAMVARRQRG